MAQYAHNKAVQNLIDRGMTPEQITEECPALDLSVWSNGEIDACTWNRGDQAKFLAYYEGKIEALDRQAEEKAAGKEEQPLAPHARSHSSRSSSARGVTWRAVSTLAPPRWRDWSS